MGGAVTTRDLSRPNGDWAHGVTPANGVAVHYVREGAGPPVFLLHGWPEFWWSWHRNIPELAADFDVIAPDLRGFGSTPAGLGPDAGPDTHATDILALADALGVERFGLVAHDVGAYVAQTIARIAPERLTGLFFFNCPYPGIGRRWVDPDHVREIWYQSFNQAPWAAALIGRDRETCRLFFTGIIDHWAHARDAFEGQLDHFVDNFMKPGVIDGGFAWYRATHEARMALVRDGAPCVEPIETPTRFYWGRHDPIIPCRWMDALGDYFLRPHIEIAEGAGHFVHIEQAQASNRRIKDFFTALP